MNKITRALPSRLLKTAAKLLFMTCLGLCLGVSASQQDVNVEAQQLFGYNPALEDLPTGNDSRLAVITSHGILSNAQEFKKKFAPLNQHYGAQSFVVTFNYPEAFIFHPATPISLWQKLKKLPLVTFGGTMDAEILLFAAKKCIAAGCQVAFIGHSMGAAAIIKCLHILTRPEEHHSSLVKLGLAHKTSGLLTLDYQQINLIKNSITKVFLANPLLSVPNTSKSLTNKVLSILTCGSTTITNLLIRPYSWMAECILRLTTGYSAREKQPIEILHELSAESFDIDVTFAKEDPVVAQEDKIQLDNIIKKMPEIRKWTTSTPNQRHGNWHASIDRLIDHVKGQALF